MTAPVSQPPLRVDLVAWSGDSTMLSARLRIPESELVRQLKRVARRDKTRLVVVASPANAGPVMAALSRLLNSEV
ncbi:MAG: hypothetical protein WAV07_09085 [Candidatus Contendobacter sp.]